MHVFFYNSFECRKKLKRVISIKALQVYVAVCACVSKEGVLHIFEFKSLDGYFNIFKVITKRKPMPVRI